METIKCTQSSAVKESAAAEEPTVQKRGRSPQKKGYLCCLLAGAAWGVAGVCGQFLFDQRGWSVDFIIPLRILLAGVLMLLLVAGLEGRQNLLRVFVSGRNRADVLVFGVLGIGLCQYSYYTTIRAANATTATILCYLGPVLIVLWVALRARRLPETNETIAVVLAALGTFLLTTHGDPSTLVLSKEALFWGLVSAFATALYSVQPRCLTAECGTLTSTGWGMVIAGVFLCLLRRPWSHMEGVFDPPAWAAFAVIVLVGSVLCFGLYFTGVALVGGRPKREFSAPQSRWYPRCSRCFGSMSPSFQWITPALRWWFPRSFSWPCRESGR